MNGFNQDKHFFPFQYTREYLLCIEGGNSFHFISTHYRAFHVIVRESIFLAELTTGILKHM